MSAFDALYEHRPGEAHPVAKIATLHKHPRNARQGDVGAIIESMQKTGFHGVVTVQTETPEGEPRNVVIAGWHRLSAWSQLGHDEVPIDPVICSDLDAELKVLADNRASDRASYDEYALAEHMSDLAARLGSLEGTGFDGDDLDDLLNKLHPPSLDELTATLGPGETEQEQLEPGYSLIKFKVPTELAERFHVVLSSFPGKSEADRLDALTRALEDTHE